MPDLYGGHATGNREGIGMITVHYPWLTVQSLQDQTRHAKGTVKGGQFARTQDVGAGMPGPVKIAR
jgi:hypothetical protein